MSTNREGPTIFSRLKNPQSRDLGLLWLGHLRPWSQSHHQRQQAWPISSSSLCLPLYRELGLLALALGLLALLVIWLQDQHLPALGLAL